MVLSLTPGGTERLVIEIVKALRTRFRMSVCCLDEPGALAPELEPMDVPVIALGRAPGFHPLLGRQLASIARRYSSDILHCHHYSPFVYGACARFWRPRMRVIFTEHGRLSDAGPSKKRHIANQVLRAVPERVYAVSEDLRQHIIEEGFFANQVRVRHNGIRIGPIPTVGEAQHARSELGLGPEAFVVGAVGRLDPVKDLETLLHAIALVRSRVPQVRLVVVGQGPERDRLTSLIERLAITDLVRLLGYRADVRQILTAFDVYVNSSVTEGVSLTILEAMAAALPVVATRVGGTPEVVVDGQTGLLVSSRNPKEIAHALNSIQQHPDWGRQLGAAGRTRVVDRFSIEGMVAEYASAYHSIDRAGRGSLEAASAKC